MGKKERKEKARMKGTKSKKGKMEERKGVRQWEEGGGRGRKEQEGKRESKKNAGRWGVKSGWGRGAGDPGR